MPETHEVFNQSPVYEDINLFDSDQALNAAVRDLTGANKQVMESLHEFGTVAGSRHALELGRLANEYPPRLRTFDRKGNRSDFVEFHPAWHELMAISTRQGLACGSWDQDSAGGHKYRNLERAAGLYMAQQMEAGHCCPIVMTNASVAGLKHQPDVADDWIPRVVVRDYDPAFRPAPEKSAVTIGMGMTEKQGGSDVRSNTTSAKPVGADGDYLITGHKWFMSAPMCDAFLILAQAPGGLSCFLMPRFLPDGRINSIRIQRLKDKLGNRSNASSEVEFDSAFARLVGGEGRGVQTIIEMVTHTRLDCAVAAAGLMRWSLATATFHASYRTAFQRKLIDQPLMRQVLADMALDHEAAVQLVTGLAAAFDRAHGSVTDAAYCRLMTPVIKYWVCKTLPHFTYEAMECHGGNGYVEEGPMARTFRESPINAIWEGSGNVMCLDVLRVIRKEPDTLAAVLDILSENSSGQDRLKSELAGLGTRLRDQSVQEAEMRILVERLALCAGAVLLNAHAPTTISDGFVASRLGGARERQYGTAKDIDVSGILERALPAL